MALPSSLSEKSSVQQTSVGTAIPEPSLVDAPVDHHPDSPLSTSGVVNVRQDDATGKHGSDKGAPKTEDAHDENVIVVAWDGPDDPENPRNWTSKRKWTIALTVSAFTFISPLSSTMIAPAAGQIASGFNITDEFQVNLSISIFVLAYAVGPLVLGPLSEIFGRTPVLRGCNLFFTAWNLGCGFAQSERQLIAFRFLAGLGGSAPLAAGGAVLGDLFAPEERGKAMALYTLAPLLGPAIGPIVGGWIAERSTWRWVFWSTSIAAGVIQIVGIFTLKESFGPVLLDRKAKKIRANLDAENSGEVRTMFQKTAKKRNYRHFFFVSICRPFILSVQEPIVQLFGLYLAFVYGIIYLVLTTIPEIYTNIYHNTPGIVGLHYIGLGIGLFVCSQINSRLSDVIYKKLKERNGGVGEPEHRLRLLVAGWGAQERTHWIVPDIGFALIGGGMVLSFQGMMMYIVEAFTMYAASALAAVSFLRSIAAFGFPLFAPAMYNRLGYGVANTILAAIAFVIGVPAILGLYTYGKKIRGMSKHANKHPMKNFKK
ncbi:MFS polyamine transporter [Lentinus tigrinus ALCF2SS1-7]|uniref:MFS polyamine transporter n=1 Tax=Lentinus tigrinus ALCF2SS1-6 TaxID=1328759 RepID=A0A5C2S6H4_9APHY|nr:MFS polyamine transporter [Lentinus tigrinus ALCF2SS1-6]RPD73627.1 MFS polyamine transporter [Lentinus tigrinus ALCF2SS1-7]